jgi:hypothetical protein
LPLGPERAPTIEPPKTTTEPEPNKSQGNFITNNIAILKSANHPVVCLFHMLFKALAIVFYFFLNLFVGNKVLTFIIIVLLDAFDFWTVKNVSGRILVGLRWWNKIKEDGTNEWMFESINVGI